MPNIEHENWQKVATFLAAGSAYLDGRTPEVIETHISLVFLTNHHVFKLKKAVSFDFLNFATVAARRDACETEVILNRRLAPDVYIGVVAVTADAIGTLTIEGSGTPVEWVVKMRRLPAEKMLDVMIAEGRHHTADIDALAVTLATFYQASAPIRLEKGAVTRRTGDHVRNNLRELLHPEHSLPESLIKRVHQRQLQFINFESEVLEQRVADGHMIDGHGDLRPEHICMEVPPVIFDCIEFNDELRCLDVADELSFLSMECDRLGASAIGETVMETYKQTSSDTPAKRLLDFYKAYRACVRAKVAVLRTAQLINPSAPVAKPLAATYLQLADVDFGWSSKAICVVVRGLSGSGKSTVAKAIAQALGMEHLQTDQIRRDLSRNLEAAAGYDSGRYRQDHRVAVYERMFEFGTSLLREQVSLIFGNYSAPGGAEVGRDQAVGHPV